MKGSELTLVFFTLFMQAAVGLLLTLGVINNFTGWKNEIAVSRGVNEKILFLACALFTAGMIISFLHLGNVKNAYLVLSNTANSWLSREVLSVIVFGAFTLLFTFTYVKNIFSTPVQNVILLLSVLSGLVLVWAMSKVYMIEIVPAWNSINTPSSFFLSSFTLGSATFLSASLFILSRKGEGILSTAAGAGIAKAIAALLFLLLAAELVVKVVHLFTLWGGERAAKESFEMLLNNNILLFSAGIVMQALSMFIVGAFYFALNGGAVRINFMYAGLCTVWIAEIIWRYLFYAVFNRTGV